MIGDVALLETLLNYRVDINKLTAVDEASPIHIALDYGHISLVKYILDTCGSTVDLTIPDADGLYP